MRNRRRQGYSLTELLTVMAIIFVLIALLLPHLFKAIRLAHRTAERNNRSDTQQQ
jgi:prepilin-type N-terminal cleavage/methylation domain-containing protein